MVERKTKRRKTSTSTATPPEAVVAPSTPSSAGSPSKRRRPRKSAERPKSASSSNSRKSTPRSRRPYKKRRVSAQVASKAMSRSSSKPAGETSDDFGAVKRRDSPVLQDLASYRGGSLLLGGSGGGGGLRGRSLRMEASRDSRDSDVVSIARTETLSDVENVGWSEEDLACFLGERPLPFMTARGSYRQRSVPFRIRGPSKKRKHARISQGGPGELKEAQRFGEPFSPGYVPPVEGEPPAPEHDQIAPSSHRANCVLSNFPVGSAAVVAQDDDVLPRFDSFVCTANGKKGTNEKMMFNEDRSSMTTFYDRCSRRHVLLYGVCDGHGRDGHVPSSIAAQEIPSRFASHYLQMPEPVQVDKQSPAEDDRPHRAFRSAFLSASRHIRDLAEEQADRKRRLNRAQVNDNGPVKLNDHGSTATYAMIDGRRVWLANCGDSGARYMTVSPKDDRHSPLERLTANHDTDDKAERRRVKKAGGNFVKIYNLQAGRFSQGKERFVTADQFAIADRTDPSRWENAPDLTRSLGHAVRSKHGMSAEPDVTEVKIEFADPTEIGVLVLASDGLWEHGDEFAEKIHQCVMNYEADAASTPGSEEDGLQLRHHLNSAENAVFEKPTSSRNPQLQGDEVDVATPTPIPVTGKKRPLLRHPLTNVSYTPPAASSQHAAASPRPSSLKPRPQSCIPTTSNASSERSQPLELDSPTPPRADSPSSRSPSSSSSSSPRSRDSSSLSPRARGRVPRTSSRLHSKNISSPPSSKRGGALTRTTRAAAALAAASSNDSSDGGGSSPAPLLTRAKSFFHHLNASASGSPSAEAPEKITLPSPSSASGAGTPRFPSPSPTNSVVDHDNGSDVFSLASTARRSSMSIGRNGSSGGHRTSHQAAAPLGPLSGHIASMLVEEHWRMRDDCTVVVVVFYGPGFPEIDREDR